MTTTMGAPVRMQCMDRSQAPGAGASNCADEVGERLPGCCPRAFADACRGLDAEKITVLMG